jgi:hypothetical protein
MPLNPETLLNDRVTAITAPGNEANLINIYNHLRSFESDYDGAQSTLRTIASAWILAAIGAIGLIIQAESSVTPSMGHEIAAPLRQALLFVAALGLGSLWYLDQRVYQRLLHAVFSLGCYLELRTTHLLPIRSRAYLVNSDITHHLGWFYRAPLLVLLCGALLSLFQAAVGLQTGVDAFLNHQALTVHPFRLWALAFIITLMHCLFFLWIWKQTARWPSLDAQLPEELLAARRQRPHQPQA